MKTNLLIFAALLLISNGIMAQRAIWAPGGDENGSGVWEDAANWSTTEIPGTTLDGRAIFKGGECFVSTDVSGTFRVELGDNKNANRAKLTVEAGGILGANRIGGGHSEVGIWSPATLIIEEGASMSTGSHFWVGSTKSYDQGTADMASEVHLNGGTITVGEMFGIDFYNDKAFSGGTFFMNGGLLDLAQWKPVDPTGASVTTSLGKHGKIVYTDGLIKIKGNHKESLEYFRDNDQITGEFEIWLEEIIGEIADSTGTMVPDTTYITKLSKDGPAVDLSTDATLSELTLSAGTLDPVFDAATANYTVELPAGTTATPTVTATPTDANATAVVTDATDVTSTEDADRTTTVVITAEDGETVLTYTVLFNVEGTSVADLDIENLIYPNPASSKLYISHAVKIDRVEIYNITGSRVINLNNITTEAIDVSDLTSGLYFISVIDVNNNNIVRKFIKQ